MIRSTAGPSFMSWTQSVDPSTARAADSHKTPHVSAPAALHLSPLKRSRSVPWNLDQHRCSADKEALDKARAKRLDQLFGSAMQPTAELHDSEVETSPFNKKRPSKGSLDIKPNNASELAPEKEKAAVVHHERIVLSLPLHTLEAMRGMPPSLQKGRPPLLLKNAPPVSTKLGTLTTISEPSEERQSSQALAITHGTQLSKFHTPITDKQIQQLRQLFKAVKIWANNVRQKKNKNKDDRFKAKWVVSESGSLCIGPSRVKLPTTEIRVIRPDNTSNRLVLAVVSLPEKKHPQAVEDEADPFYGYYKLGHPNLVGGRPEQFGRISGEIYYEKAADTQPAHFVINNDSGRLGQRFDLTMMQLQGVADYFRVLGFPMKVEWVEPKTKKPLPQKKRPREATLRFTAVRLNEASQG